MTTELKSNPNEKSTEDSKPENSEVEQIHPIAKAITSFIHRAHDIKLSHRFFIPLAGQLMKERFNEFKAQIDNSQLLLASIDSVEQIHGTKEMGEAIRKFKRIQHSQIPQTIETSLFLSLFSMFDTYTGELLTTIYERKPELFDKLNRKIDLVDVLTANSIDDLKRSVLEDIIETFRRKSYVEQFTELETTFGIKLRSFTRWPDFVECTQRRNLLTHCGGIVSEQYIKVCSESGYPKTNISPVGTKLTLGPRYFLSTCELMIEVGVKLGQTLWRKILPGELEDAESHLHHTQYDALYWQNWGEAIIFGEFAVKQREVSSEKTRRLGIINYCIALKFSGDAMNVQKELDKVDWSASANDFRLAEAVLEDRFGDAASLMERIGTSGDMVNEQAYHTWPLFHVFRESADFITAYEKIYHHPFVAELKRAAVAALADASSTKENTADAKCLEEYAGEAENSQ